MDDALLVILHPRAQTTIPTSSITDYYSYILERGYR